MGAHRGVSSPLAGRASQAARQPGSLAAWQPGSQAATQPDSQTARQPDSQTARQPDSQTARQPGSQAARQPGSQAARQSGSQAARQPGSHPSETHQTDQPVAWQGTLAHGAKRFCQGCSAFFSWPWRSRSATTFRSLPRSVEGACSSTELSRAPSGHQRLPRQNKLTWKRRLKQSNCVSVGRFAAADAWHKGVKSRHRCTRRESNPCCSRCL